MGARQEDKTTGQRETLESLDRGLSVKHGVKLVQFTRRNCYSVRGPVRRRGRATPRSVPDRDRWLGESRQHRSPRGPEVLLTQERSTAPVRGNPVGFGHYLFLRWTGKVVSFLRPTTSGSPESCRKRSGRHEDLRRSGKPEGRRRLPKVRLRRTRGLAVVLLL